MPANEPRQSKAERREAARKEAERLAARQRSTERRNRLIIAVASVLVVALIGVAGFFIWQESQRTLLSEFEGERPAASTDSGGITFGSTLEAGTVTEDATEVQVYIDFICPVCGSYDEVNRDDIRTMLTEGEATVVFHPLNYLDQQSMGTNYSTRAANALATVSTDAPEVALDFLEALFDNQPAEGTEGLSDAEMAAIAVEVGVPQEVADTFAAGTYSEWVAVASDQAREDGVTGTPTTFLDGSRWTGDWSTPGTLLQAVRDAA
ncbi:DsbA family protein [Pseudactinotalea suaedae]|jgi:protein-disulfide isomerase|uniref:DsbA family protein n=1 Tax=Pseudactinotalea suaedae TaxID=1524924 RepID=UPI0012E2B14A|nr:thioredoxin domain-containing protein [Pseudactinotalea suaedae]